ncbi:MAG: hypothetical protein HWD59_15215 [Coxiellaceae bacterium]|nr:MAG: hypothetical protein HWD59_15215 [Coxiellaceae bacterium]
MSFSIPKINNDAIIDLKPGETASIVLSANIEKLGKSAWGLVFNRATYVIELQKQYKIWFSLEEYKSNVVTLSFLASSPHEP